MSEGGGARRLQKASSRGREGASSASTFAGPQTPPAHWAWMRESVAAAAARVCSSPARRRRPAARSPPRTSRSLPTSPCSSAPLPSRPSQSPSPSRRGGPPSSSTFTACCGRATSGRALQTRRCVPRNAPAPQAAGGSPAGRAPRPRCLPRGKPVPTSRHLGSGPPVMLAHRAAVRTQRQRKLH